MADTTVVPRAGVFTAGSGLTITGTNITISDAELVALMGLTSAANKVPYFTGSGTAALADFTAAGRALVDDADATAQRATLGLVIGTDIQAYNASLASISAGTWVGANSITTLGTITTGVWNGTAVPVTSGGTGATNATSARTNLGAAASGAATASGLTMATARLLGRTTASTGAIEEISIGTNLTMSAGTLNATTQGDASTNTSSSTDSEMVLFSGTGGKILKRASAAIVSNGIVKLTSGVPSIASQGSDYWSPSGTVVSVASGGTGASSAGTAATNLGLGTGDNVTHLTVTGAEASTGSGNGGLVATTATAGGNAGIRLASGGTNRFQIGCIGSAGSTAMRFYVYEASAEGCRIDAGRNFAIGTTVTPSAGTSCLILGVAGTALTPHSSQCGLYGETITATTELRAVDGAGNRVTLTPHPGEVLSSHVERMAAAKLQPLFGSWGYRSVNDFTGIETLADIGGAIRAVEFLMQRAGVPLPLIWERTVNDSPMTWESRQAQAEQQYRREADWHDHLLRRYVAQPFWVRDEQMQMPILGSDKPPKVDQPAWLAEAVTRVGV